MDVNDCLDELVQAHREIDVVYEERDKLTKELEAARDQERQHEAIIQDLIADLKGTRTQLTEAQTEIKQYEEDVEMLNRALGDTNDGCVGLEKNLEATRESLSNVLDIVDGEDMQAAIMSAWIHGVVASKEVSQRASAIMGSAYELLGKERPKGGV